MPRQSTRVKVNIRLEESDLDAIKTYYPVLGYNEVIRSLVSKHVIQLKKRDRELAYDDSKSNDGSRPELNLDPVRARSAEPDQR